MAAPSVIQLIDYVMGNSGQTPIESPILPVPTSIIPSTFATPSTSTEGIDLSFSLASAVTYGGRVNFSATRDLSARKYIGWQMTQLGWPFPNLAAFIDTYANGGLSVVWFDALGNWSEFNLYGSEYTNTDFDSGGWGAFRGYGLAGCNQLALDKDYPPDNASGVLDWSQIDGFEYIIRVVNTGGSSPTMGFGSIILFDPPTIIDGEIADPAGFDDLSAAIRAPNFNYNQADVFKDTGGNFTGGIGEIYESRGSYSIGDGVTTTYFRDTGSTTTPYPIAGSGNETMPSVMIEASERILTINQSATDDIEFNGTILAATDILIGNQDSVIVTGSALGSCVFNAIPFYNKTLVELAHANAPNATFYNCEQVRIQLQTTLTDSTLALSSATSKGIYTDDVAGTYTQSIDFRATNLGEDITVNPPIAGTYDFPNITVESGHTLKLRNDSATEALTIGIPTGIPFTTSTAGGTITVSTPPVTITYFVPNLIDDTNCILFNVTQNNEIGLPETISGGSGFSRVLTLGVDYNANDQVVLLAGYQQAGVAKEIFRAAAVLNTSDYTNNDSQRDWENPNVLAIDGSNIPECQTDFIEIQVEVDDADNTTQKARIAAFIVDAVSTFGGLRNWVSKTGIPVIDYPTSTSAIIDTDVATVEIINIKPSSTLQIKDSFEFYWKDGIDRISAIPNQDSNYEWIAPIRVLPLETGVSGLTPTESAKLLATAEQSTLLETQGAGFDTNNDSLVEIRDNLGGGGGDATEANQTLMLANQTTIISNQSALQAGVDAVPTAAQNADSLLYRSNQGGKDTGITVSESLMTIGRNKWDLDPNTGLMRVYEDDESTVSFSIQTTLGARDPVNSGDPV